MLVRSLSPTGLFKDTIQSSRRQVIAWFSCNGHTTRLRLVLELSVAAFGCDEEPAIFSQFVQYIADFHGISLAQSLQEAKLALREPAAS
jgi:fructose-1,6-bisphosphatase